jgi:GNAT superfamily N-acetyltransferase
MTRATFRAGTPEDNDLVFGAWMRRSKSLMRAAALIPDDYWYSDRGMRGKIAELEDRVTIAEYNGAVLGFAVSDSATNRLHWIHVKPEFRGLKISMVLLVGTGIREETALDDAAPLGCAFASSYIQAIQKHFNPRAFYDPFAM